MNILEEIIAYKKTEIDQVKEKLPLQKLKNLIKQNKYKKRDFYQSVKNRINQKQIALIAEIKKASPSKGIIKKDFNPTQIAMAYNNGGATCLSVLTDQKYFQGNLNHIKEVKDAVNLPVLRKDFIVDHYQIYESIYYGADCILLIVGVLRETPLQDLYEMACENEIDTLIEIHDEREMDVALNMVGACHGVPLLGINNRDLKTFEANLNITKNLVKKYKHDLKDKIIVSESGIFTNQDIRSLMECGVYTFLVGESLIKESNIEKATKELIFIS